MVESQQPLRCSFVKGRGLPLCKGASAKALLAFMPREDQMAVLRRLQQEKLITAEERAGLGKELARIQKQGYATTDSEVDDGVWGISAPVFQQASHAAAVVTLMAPNTRIKNRTQSFTDMTVRVASRISSRLQSL
jgi:DNA-binding IclR family transcriptional regulator